MSCNPLRTELPRSKHDEDLLIATSSSVVDQHRNRKKIFGTFIDV